MFKPLVKFLIKTIVVILFLVSIIVLAALMIQKYNTNTIVSKNLDGKLIPKGVNSKSKLNTILDSNLASMEMDIIYDNANGIHQLFLAHSHKDKFSITLDEYLSITHKKPLKKIWLDIKNVNSQNSKPIFEYLKRLDSSYGIKSFAIVETSFTGKELSLFSDYGFHTSYYLPTGYINNLLMNKEQEQMSKEAKRIASLIHERHFSAVSFKTTLYPFVKNHLEANIDSNIVYHTWSSKGVYRPGNLNTLTHLPVYMDERVKTFIFKYLFFPEV